MTKSNPIPLEITQPEGIAITLQTVMGYQFFQPTLSDDARTIADILQTYESVYIWPKEQKTIITSDDLIEINPEIETFDRFSVYLIKIPEGIESQTFYIKSQYPIENIYSPYFDDYYITDKVRYTKYIDCETKLFSHRDDELVNCPVICFTITHPTHNLIGFNMLRGYPRYRYWKEICTSEIITESEIPYNMHWAIVFPGHYVVVMAEPDWYNGYFLPIIGSIQEISIEPLRTGKEVIIFLSPQYKADTGILNAIATYKTAVFNDIGWDVSTYLLTDAENDFKKIDETIENFYDFYPLKACIMVGEDIGTALHADTSYYGHDAPSTVPWYTRGLEDAYRYTYQVTQAEQHMNIAVSLIYPNYNDSYSTKSNQITAIFNKFATNRSKVYDNRIISLLSVKGHGFCDPLCFSDRLVELGTLIQYEDPSEAELTEVLHGEYRMVVANGHAGPSAIWVKWIDGEAPTIFYVNPHARGMNSPALLIGGCYVGGWDCSPCREDIYDPPQGVWFGHQIFDNPDLRIVIAGAPCQRGYDGPNFLSECIADLAAGKTIAEAMINKYFTGDSQTLFGDPTFHY